MYRVAISNFKKNTLLCCCKNFVKPNTIILNKSKLFCSSFFGSLNLFSAVHVSVNLTLVKYFHASSIHFKAKGKKTSGKIKEVIRAVDAAEVVDLDEVQNNLKAVINNLKNDYAVDYRVGSDIPLDELEVVIEGDTYALNEVAQISRPSPHLIQIDMVDFPEFVSVVEKAICSSKWNLNPVVTGTILKVSIPQATAERRTMISKAAKQRLTSSKLELREIVNDLHKSFKNHEKMTDDFEHILKQQISIYFDHFVAEAESLYKGKEKEILNPS